MVHIYMSVKRISIFTNYTWPIYQKYGNNVIDDLVPGWWIMKVKESDLQFWGIVEIVQGNKQILFVYLDVGE